MAKRLRKAAPPAPALKQETFVIFTSPTGRAPWHPLKAEEVPDWVKNPDTMARLADGEECMDCAEGERGSSWYRAVRLAELQESLRSDH